MTNHASVPIWLEIRLHRVNDEVHIEARGSRKEESTLRPLGVSEEVLKRFAKSIERAAIYGQPLSAGTIQDAQAIHKAVLEGEVGRIHAKLCEASGNSLLVRFIIEDPDLQLIPWEALCPPREALGFWGTSLHIFPVRGIVSGEPWIGREVLGSVNVLAIAPTDDASVVNLREALDERIRSGEINWLEPIVGKDARVDVLRARLRTAPKPHIIHYIGHGGTNAAGAATLRLASNDGQGEAHWPPAQALAEELSQNIHHIRLVVLESCAGAKPSAFSSAAETLIRKGIGAVVAHAWPVKAEVARDCSMKFYRDIVNKQNRYGDVALALNNARLALLTLHESAGSALSPVLYLRSTDSRIFVFPEQQPGRRPPPPSFHREIDATLPPELLRILGGPFSLILGDRWEEHNAPLAAFRQVLLETPDAPTDGPLADLPIGTLAQWYYLHYGRDNLTTAFQKAFRDHCTPPPVIDQIARWLGPGVHTTLLRTPWLEMSLAAQHPQRTITLIQGSDHGFSAMRREAGASGWRDLLRALPKDIDVKSEIVVLRPCGGYSPDMLVRKTLLTDDDYCDELHNFLEKKELPIDVKNMFLGTLSWRPTLLLGLSVHTANHRMILHGLHSRGIPRDSLVVIDDASKGKQETEAEVWHQGLGLPPHARDTSVLKMSSAALALALGANPIVQAEVGS